MEDSEIVKTLTLMCDKDNPQDKKLLLLAELVETRCSSLAEHQRELKESLQNTNDKLDKVTELLEEQQNEGRSCPVYKNKESFEKVSFFIKYPRFSLIVALGIAALLAGFISSDIFPILKIIFGV